MKRITFLAAAGALVLTPLAGAVTAYAATSDASPAAVHQQLTDRRGEPEPGDDHGHHGRHHRHHDLDGQAGQQRHGEAEPGDDHGRHRHGDDGAGHR